MDGYQLDNLYFSKIGTESENSWLINKDCDYAFCITFI